MPTSPGEKPLLQYSKEFLLQQRYSPLSWTTPAFVPQSEGGIARSVHYLSYCCGVDDLNRLSDLSEISGSNEEEVLQMQDFGKVSF